MMVTGQTFWYEQQIMLVIPTNAGKPAFRSSLVVYAYILFLRPDKVAFRAGVVHACHNPTTTIAHDSYMVQLFPSQNSYLMDLSFTAIARMKLSKFPFSTISGTSGRYTSIHENIATWLIYYISITRKV